MNAKYVFLLGYILPLVSASAPVDIRYGYDRVCVLYPDKISCTGVGGHGQTQPIRGFKDASQLAFGGRHTCVLDREGVWCWGYNGYDQTIVPQLQRPTFLQSYSSHVCAIDRDGVKCWGQKLQRPLPNLKNPSEIYAGERDFCAIDSGEVLCWNPRGEKTDTTPTNLSNPRNLVSTPRGKCVVDDHGVHCWGNDAGVKRLENFENVDKVYLDGVGGGCVVTDREYGAEMRCVGNVPKLPKKNVKGMSLANGIACALYYDGQHLCRGNFVAGEFVPEPN